MRHAIIADIHGNLAALTAVFDDIERRGGVDDVWCLGDVVGYGPEPSACISLLRTMPVYCIAGNHDHAASVRIDVAAFSPDAARATHWTMSRLSPGEKGYLYGLPQKLVRNNFTLVHGSPRGPLWEYLDYAGAATENLAYFETACCLVGHTHVPMVFTADAAGNCTGRHWLADNPVVPGESRLIVNPGSVGQPRDGDPRASYALYDDARGSLRLYRIGYDIRATQRKMQQLGLPERLIYRLQRGL